MQMAEKERGQRLFSKYSPRKYRDRVVHLREGDHSSFDQSSLGGTYRRKCAGCRVSSNQNGSDPGRAFIVSYVREERTGRDEVSRQEHGLPLVCSCPSSAERATGDFPRGHFYCEDCGVLEHVEQTTRNEPFDLKNNLHLAYSV